MEEDNDAIIKLILNNYNNNILNCDNKLSLMYVTNLKYRNIIDNFINKYNEKMCVELNLYFATSLYIFSNNVYFDMIKYIMISPIRISIIGYANIKDLGHLNKLKTFNTNCYNCYGLHLLKYLEICVSFNYKCRSKKLAKQIYKLNNYKKHNYNKECILLYYNEIR